MTSLFAPALLLFAAQAVGGGPEIEPAPPTPLPPLGIEQQTALKCGVAFGIVAQLQKAGQPEGAKYPPLAARGREFFVRAAARIMDETGADRGALGELVLKQTADFAADEASLPAIMPACIQLLDASGL